MKKILIPCLLFLALVLAGKSLSAQKLEFNQVVVQTFDGTSPTYVVPTGKVWKIESAGVNSNGFLYILTLNGVNISQVIAGNGASTYGETLPLWLPGGATISYFENGNSQAFISIIEFNVVP